MEEIKRLKILIQIELDKRKELKKQSMQMDAIQTMLSEILTK